MGLSPYTLQGKYFCFEGAGLIILVIPVSGAKSQKNGHIFGFWDFGVDPDKNDSLFPGLETIINCGGIVGDLWTLPGGANLFLSVGF